MNKISVFLVSVLVLAWGYTSWYWYVCNIKGLCEVSQEIIETPMSKEDSLIENDEADSQAITTETNVQGDNILRSDDVLSTDSQANIEATAEEERITDDNDTMTSSGELDIIDNDEIENEAAISSSTTLELCTLGIVGPIAFGGNNNTAEVERLEEFLISRGESLVIDGLYGQDDFDAVKRFQLEFKEEILIPWDIVTPTGYVFTTTIKTMNSVACN